MSEKKSAEDQLAQKNDSYATKIFQESSVGLVSSIFQTNSLKRRTFKVLALLLCLFGFLYQSGEFLAMVFQYPTTVDLEINRPTILTVPGLTFCDNNGISRRIFCKKYPDKCIKATAAFCKQFVDYCEGILPLMPKKEYYDIGKNMTLEELIDVNVKLEQLVKMFPTRIRAENITGPSVRKLYDFHGGHGPGYLCYSFNDRVNNSLVPLTWEKDKLMKTPVNKLSFTIRWEDVFVPGTTPGILLSVHSPFEAVNPLENGIFMESKRSYSIFVSMEEEVLLQNPYPTNCINYTEQWEKRGRTGPRTQNMCLHECVLGITMHCFNCVAVPPVYYPTKHKACITADYENSTCSDVFINTWIDNCESKCRDDCSRTKYTYTVQERFSPNLVENIESEDDLYTKVDVQIYLEGDEIVVLKHSPKYMFVEVFSNIGGFIGCWLGISLLGIFDIFEGFFRIFLHSRKIKQGSTESSKI